MVRKKEILWKQFINWHMVLNLLLFSIYTIFLYGAFLAYLYPKNLEASLFNSPLVFYQDYGVVMFSWLNFKGNYSWYIYLIPLIAAISLSFYLPDKSKRFIFSIRGILANLGFLLLFAPLVVMPLHKYEQNIVVNVGETDTELVQAWLDSCDDKFGEDASLNKIKESWAHGFIHPKMEYKPDNLVNKHKGIDDYKPITLKSGKVVALDSFITSPKKISSEPPPWVSGQEGRIIIYFVRGMKKLGNKLMKNMRRN